MLTKGIKTEKIDRESANESAKNDSIISNYPIAIIFNLRFIGCRLNTFTVSVHCSSSQSTQIHPVKRIQTYLLEYIPSVVLR